MGLIFGHVEIRSWFEQQPDGSAVGMGSKTEYDKDGKIVAHSVTTTGLVIRRGED